jgi:hypothetical protein
MERFIVLTTCDEDCEGDFSYGYVIAESRGEAVDKGRPSRGCCRVAAILSREDLENIGALMRDASALPIDAQREDEDEPSVCLAGNPTRGDLPCGDPDCVCA